MLRLMDRQSVSVGSWREYANLARAVLPRVVPHDIAGWITFVHSDMIYPDEGEICDVLASPDRNPADITEQERIRSTRSRLRVALASWSARRSRDSALYRADQPDLTSGPYRSECG